MTASRVTTVFMSGNSQAVRIPKDLRFDVDKVELEVVPDGILLRPYGGTLRDNLRALREFERATGTEGITIEEPEDLPVDPVPEVH